MKKDISTERKICAVTGSRAEYDLLSGLMKAIEAEPGLKLQAAATGMHLSRDFGYTFSEVEKDFPDVFRVDSLSASNTPEGISASIASGIVGFTELFSELKPDLLLVLGDRYEIFAAAVAAMTARIPIAHLHGGETTEGAIDEAIRHSITKMSHIHLTGAEPYRKRVIQLGENPELVFNVGGMGVAGIHDFKPLSRKELEESIDFRLGEKFFLVTFHPVTLEGGSSAAQFGELLKALDTRKDTSVIFTAANADAGGTEINSMIQQYVSENPDRCVYIESMGKKRYLSALSHTDAVVGNSSSGLAEAPSFRVPTVNIGSRQAGRIRAESVIDCEPDEKSISEAIGRIYTDSFRKELLKSVNPYGEGDNIRKIIKILKDTPLENILLKKFHDL